MKASSVISDDVKSGKYFTEARTWYNKVHLHPVSEIAVVSVFAIVAAIIFFASTTNLYSIFPSKIKVNTIVNMQNTLEYYPVLRTITRNGISNRDAVAQYLCKKYIIAREGYNYKFLSSDFNFLYRSSTPQVFNPYYQNLQLSNPYSPIVQYKDDFVVTVDIKDETIQTDRSYAVVKFDTMLSDVRGKMISSKSFMANLSYYLDPNYDFNRSTNSKLDFIVTDYKVQTLGEE